MMTESTERPPSALDGVRVLDLAGPRGVYCGKLLADLGADVIRVEPPAGDASRRIAPFYQDEPGLERSLFHWHFNANKRGITLDLSTTDGRALFTRLAASAAIVIESFQPGYLDSLGIGYETLRGANPRLVLVSITPFGQDGPYRDYQGEELIAQASGGLLWMCGWPDRPPVMMGGYPALHEASAQAAVGALLALEAAEETGEGLWVDQSAQAAMPLTLMASMYDYYATGVQRQPRVGAGQINAVNGLFEVADGYIDSRFRGRPRNWEHLLEWMDSKGMAEDLVEERWREPAFRARPDNYRHIADVFQRFILQFTREEAMDLGHRHDLTVGAVYTAEDLLREPQLLERHYFVELEHEELGRSFVYPGAPYRLSETPWRLRRRAPLLGEHNVEVYGEELGLSSRQLETLRALGVV
jgi:benzylsuccinate CoA-transferase BbsE subunit